MEEKIAKLLTSRSTIEFGDISLSEDEKKFCQDWNQESILLFKSLPESTQTDALLFLIKYAKTSFEELDLLKMYYVPAWSIIFWLIHTGPDRKSLLQKNIKDAKAAHFMAMFLHALDDHLIDHQLPVTHLALLLRSHAWMIMNNALASLSGDIDGGPDLVQRFIDDYYSSIRNTDKIESLDRYCDCFRKQMATWLIVPTLMAKKTTADVKFSEAIKTAYGSFGLAWRLLDDINDIEADLLNGAKSSIYVCLPEDIQNLRDQDSEGVNKADNADYIKAGLKYILQNNIIQVIKQRICKELEFAASIANNYDMMELATEFRCLYKPLLKRQEY